MKHIRVFASLLVLAAAAANVAAQACGEAFGSIEVIDKKGKPIPGATIEILGPVRSAEGGQYANAEAAMSVAPADADELLLKSKEIYRWGRTADSCDNPLRQTFFVTKVKYREPHIEPPNTLGYCTLETYGVPFLLRVTATHYTTRYYRAAFLGGCGYRYRFTLVKGK